MNETLYPHVHQTAQHYFELSDENRMIACSNDFWVPHPAAERVISQIRFSMKMKNRIVAPCMIVAAAGGTGKSAMVNQLKERNLYSDDKLIFVTMHQNPNNYSLRDLILVAMGLGVGKLARQGGNITPQLQNRIKSQNIRGIVIDEVHDALTLTPAQQSVNLSLLKNLSSDIYGLSVFAFGVEAAANVLRRDPQLERRYAVKHLASWENGAEFRSFVASYIHRLPLKKVTNLKDQILYLKIMDKGLGLTDNIVKILQSAAMAAVIDGSEHITYSHIDNIDSIMEDFSFALRAEDADAAA